MLTEGEREALVIAIARLAAEQGCSNVEKTSEACLFLATGRADVETGSLDPADEVLVRKVRRSLADLAAVLGATGGGRGAERAVISALDSAEMVMRGELLSGNSARLPALLPSFVFLIALVVAGQDRALDLSCRAKQLIEAGC